MLRTRKIPEYLIQAIVDIYAEARYTVADCTFSTGRGLKQGCPLSPILFALYISDLEDCLCKWQSGGIVVGKSKFHSLAYADDIVLLA